MSCKAPLIRPISGRTTCSRAAVEDGYCRGHFNRYGGANRVQPPAPVTVQIQAQSVMNGRQPPAPVRPAAVPRRANNTVPSQVRERQQAALEAVPHVVKRDKYQSCKTKKVLSGVKFDCLICYETVAIEENMNLHCGDAICHTCFEKLSDIKCPFCRKDMMSEKIKQKDLREMRDRSLEFKRDMAERTFRGWVEDDIANNVGGNDFLAVLQDDLLEDMLARFVDHEPDPELNSDIDGEMLSIVINAMLVEDLPLNDFEASHDRLHNILPLYGCVYLASVYNRASDMMIIQ